MKRIVGSNNIFYIFKPSFKNDKRRLYEDIFVPKFYLNLYHLSKKKKILKVEHKKYEDKDYLLNINSYFKQEQIDNINVYNTNTGNKSVQNKIYKMKNRFFSANPKELPKIKYTVNDILNANFKSIPKNMNNRNKNNEISQKNTLSLSNKKENKTLKYTDKEKESNNIKIMNNIKRFKINDYKSTNNNVIKDSKNNCEFQENEKNNEKDKNVTKSRNQHNLNESENLKLETTSIKNSTPFKERKFNFNIKSKNKYYNFNKSITKTKININFNILKDSKKDKNQEKDYSDNSKNLKKSIKIMKQVNQPLKLKNSLLLMNNYCIFKKKKIAPKLPQIIKLNNFKIKYKTKDEIISLFSGKIIEYALLNNNLLYPQEKFHYYINKKYRYQLINYMKHRINWEYYDANYDETINFEWKYFSNKVNFKKFKYDNNTPLINLKMINLFEKNYEVGNKKNLFINLISYCNEIGYNIFDVVPFTLIISNSKDLEFSFKALKELMDFVPKENNIENNIITNRKYNEHCWYDKNYEFINQQYINFNKNFISNKNYWILKPPDLYQGKCIEICNDFEEIRKKCKKIFKGVDKTHIAEFEYEDESYDENESNNIYSKKPTKFYCCNDIIIQKYLDYPLLYQKRKFDIRCFVLVDSNLNVFFCKEGHLKGCSEYYDLNKTNKFIHITNYSFQKNSFNFEKFEIGNEISYTDFKKYLKKEGIPLQKFDDMINQMKFLIKLSFKAVKDKLKKIDPVLCFEIFGYDFILDKDFKPWILEINDNPGLCISSPVIEKLIPRMLDDAFRLTIDKVFNTKYSKDCFDSKGDYISKFRLDGFNNNENIFEFICNLN